MPVKVLYIGDSETVISRYAVGADVFEQLEGNRAVLALRPATHDASVAPDARPDIAGAVKNSRCIVAQKPGAVDEAPGSPPADRRGWPRPDGGAPAEKYIVNSLSWLSIGYRTDILMPVQEAFPLPEDTGNGR